MHFPISGVEIPIVYLILIGFAVGVCGGFWGVGGGWLATPGLFILGMPMNMAIGTSLAYVVGQAIVSTFRHARFGNVDVRAGLLLTAASMGGVEVGVRAIEYLGNIGRVEEVVGIACLILLGTMATFTFVESVRARRQLKGLKDSDGEVRDVVMADFSRKLQGVRIPPLVACPTSGIDSISIWAILGIGLVLGMVAGFLGVGGGFVGLPMMVYLIGIPTHIAVGTSLFQITLVASYATFSHALQQNVDVMVALVMLLGASVGAQIGTFATRYVHGTEIRFLFGVGIIGAWVSLVLRMVGSAQISTVVILAVGVIMSASIVAYLVRGLIEARQTRTGHLGEQ